MTQDLDALPLPVPTHFRNGVLYAFSADQIRADREMVWELAMRKAQEGWKLVGYVCRPIEWNPRQSETVVKITRRQQSEYGFTHPVYDSPPHKSDEARDALISIGGQLASVAFNLAQRAGHALTGDDVAMLDKLRKQWDAALSAQQKGNK